MVEKDPAIEAALRRILGIPEERRGLLARSMVEGIYHKKAADVREVPDDMQLRSGLNGLDRARCIRDLNQRRDSNEDRH